VLAADVAEIGHCTRERRLVTLQTTTAIANFMHVNTPKSEISPACVSPHFPLQSAWELELTDVICPDLQSLLLPVQQPDSVVLLVLQQPDLPDASLFPLASIMIKSVQLALAATHVLVSA
jgi:hypothetical protein